MKVGLVCLLLLCLSAKGRKFLGVNKPAAACVDVVNAFRENPTCIQECLWRWTPFLSHRVEDDMSRIPSCLFQQSFQAFWKTRKKVDKNSLNHTIYEPSFSSTYKDTHIYSVWKSTKNVSFVHQTIINYRAQNDDLIWSYARNVAKWDFFEIFSNTVKYWNNPKRSLTFMYHCYKAYCVTTKKLQFRSVIGPYFDDHRTSFWDLSIPCCLNVVMPGELWFHFWSL